MLRILPVNDTEKPIGELRDALAAAGYEVLEDVAAAGALLKAVESRQPDVIIIDVDSPSRDTLEQLAVVHHHARCWRHSRHSSCKRVQASSLHMTTRKSQR